MNGFVGGRECSSKSYPQLWMHASQLFRNARAVWKSNTWGCPRNMNKIQWQFIFLQNKTAQYKQVLSKVKPTFTSDLDFSGSIMSQDLLEMLQGH